MDDQLKRIFARLRETCDFAETDFSDVNAWSSEGDNGLHGVVRWGDLSAAKALIDAGIDVNKAGDLGYTPRGALLAEYAVRLKVLTLPIEYGWRFRFANT